MLDPDGSDADLNPLDDAIDMALASLRAQQTPVKLDRSRWEGCGYCSDPADAESFDFAYCPYCGTPQTQEAWEKLERRINDGTTD